MFRVTIVAFHSVQILSGSGNFRFFLMKDVQFHPNFLCSFFFLLLFFFFGWIFYECCFHVNVTVFYTRDFVQYRARSLKRRRLSSADFFIVYK